MIFFLLWAKRQLLRSCCEQFVCGFMMFSLSHKRSFFSSRSNQGQRKLNLHKFFLVPLKSGTKKMNLHKFFRVPAQIRDKESIYISCSANSQWLITIIILPFKIGSIKSLIFRDVCHGNYNICISFILHVGKIHLISPPNACIFGATKLSVECVLIRNRTTRWNLAYSPLFTDS